MSVSLSIALPATIYFLVTSLIHAYIAHSFVGRAIVVCPILGLILGDLKMGLLLGAELELVFMGVTTIGGSLPSDTLLASVLVTTFCVGAGVDLASASVLAVAIGVVSGLFEMMIRVVIAGAYVPFFDNWAETGNTNAYQAFGIIGQFLLRIPPTIIVFLAIYLGAESVQNLMNSIPESIQHGLEVASGMMPAIGLAMLMNMLWSLKMSIYFFVGFAVTVYLQVDMTFMVIIAAFITVEQVFRELDLKDTLSSFKPSLPPNDTQEEDDFFD